MKIQKAVFNTGSILFLFTAFGASSAWAASAGLPAQGGNQFWTEVQALVQHCSVQPYTVTNGQKTYGRLESTCPDIQVQNSQARFLLNGQWYVATIADSIDADEGDLNDIFVTDAEGSAYAARHEIPAFGDVLIGLAGARVQFQEQYVQELSSQ